MAILAVATCNTCKMTTSDTLSDINDHVLGKRRICDQYGPCAYIIR